MTRLYFDLLRNTGTRYYFALDQTPGIVSPDIARLTLNGQVPAAAQPTTVFRTPTQATLTLAGLSLASPTLLQPNKANLAMGGLLATLVRQLTLVVSAPSPVETPEQDIPPTLLTIRTVTPAPAALTLLTLEQAVTQGGNIGFVFPGKSTLTVGGLQAAFLTSSTAPAGLSIQGYAPTLTLLAALTVNPEVGSLILSQLEPVLITPFHWVDDDPVATPIWIDDPP
jgi:hypothetical protein